MSAKLESTSVRNSTGVPESRSEQVTAASRYSLNEQPNTDTPAQGNWMSLSLANSTSTGVPAPTFVSNRGISANEVAGYFLAKCDEAAGDLISNLKLQKLLYYAQGFCLALTSKPLFHEPIEAWTHGPVVPAVYHRFKDYRDFGLPIPADIPQFDSGTQELLDEVYAVYGQFSAWKLRNMTHLESPWRDTPTGETISEAALKAYFTTQLV
jgi:uncharacterized phage-associated protein